MNKSTKRGSANSYLTHTTYEKGITLIALVVTIVVLLILAGITINLVLSEDGIFKKAQDAKNTWEQAVQNDLDAIDSLTEQINSILNNTGSSSGEGETPIVSVESVALNKETATIITGETLNLTATVAPSNATDKNVTWTSDDEDIATVDNNGVVTAKTAGTATIKRCRLFCYSLFYPFKPRYIIKYPKALQINRLTFRLFYV